jgi:hypothetical protein
MQWRSSAHIATSVALDGSDIVRLASLACCHEVADVDLSISLPDACPPESTALHNINTVCKLKQPADIVCSHKHDVGAAQASLCGMVCLLAVACTSAKAVTDSRAVAMFLFRQC